MSEILPNRLARLASEAQGLLERAVQEHGRVVYANSLGAEAMVLTDLIWSHVPGIEMFTLDTGRLHEETRELLDRLERRYERRMQLYHPEARAVEAWVAGNGVNGFYLGQTERLSCCQIRKVEPFRRAIAGKRAWVTGVRREQSQDRAQGSAIEWDEKHGLWKLSPLLDWRETDVWDYIHARKLPYNPLHDQGYPSIGCAPCTRAVHVGADPRSGRWWWESPDARECGLHPRRRVIPIAVESRGTGGC